MPAIYDPVFDELKKALQEGFKNNQFPALAHQLENIFFCTDRLANELGAELFLQFRQEIPPGSNRDLFLCTQLHQLIGVKLLYNEGDKFGPYIHQAPSAMLIVQFFSNDTTNHIVQPLPQSTTRTLLGLFTLLGINNDVLIQKCVNKIQEIKMGVTKQPSTQTENKPLTYREQFVKDVQTILNATNFTDGSPEKTHINNVTIALTKDGPSKAYNNVHNTLSNATKEMSPSVILSFKKNMASTKEKILQCMKTHHEAYEREEVEKKERKTQLEHSPPSSKGMTFGNNQNATE